LPGRSMDQSAEPRLATIATSIAITT
jgi:hypothetical protein